MSPVLAIFILFFCLFMISVSRGMGESFGVFLLPLSDTFDWDRASVTSIYSVYMFSLGIGSLISGIIFDKFFGTLYGILFSYILFSSILYLLDNNNVDLLSNLHDFFIENSNILYQISEYDYNFLENYTNTDQ